MGHNDEGQRATNTAAILELRERGLTTAEVAAELGLGHSTVRNYLWDPDGSKDRARKDSYRGTCEDCGKPTTGSDGPALAPRLCAPCSAKDQKIWTRDTVIAAIQRFAFEHGRPPTAEDWIGADPERGYPSRGAVYRSSNKRTSAPFQYWADAIEAAGFPRPDSGRRTIKEGSMAHQARMGYAIMHEEEEGLWRLVSESEEPTQISALNAALNGSAPSGRWIAVPRKFWHPREIKPKTIYDWADA
jgi:hypothetical protein